MSRIKYGLDLMRYDMIYKQLIIKIYREWEVCVLDDRESDKKCKKCNKWVKKAIDK